MDKLYIQQVASNMIKQLGITEAALGYYGAESLYKNCADDVMGLVLPMSPETLGRICAFGRGTSLGGRTSLHAVHRCRYLNEYADGLTLLREIACTTIIAQIYDIFQSRQNRGKK